MSQLEISNNLIYSAPITLAAGSNGIASITPANLNGTSKILSIVRTAAGGTVGVPKVLIALGAGDAAVPPAGAVWTIKVASSVTTDTSTYNVYWVNSYNPSQLYAQTGSGAGVQYPA